MRTRQLPLEDQLLVEGMTSSFVDVRDLRYHYLDCQARHEESGSNGKAPLIVLLHGFPELAYSWRKVMIPLSREGYRVVAPDQRGYGRSTTSRTTYSDDTTPFSVPNLVEDVKTFIHALGYEHAAALVGHDAGSIVAGFCAWLYPETFHSVVMMSAPFTTQLPGSPTGTKRVQEWRSYLQQLEEPRKYYMDYFCSSAANRDMFGEPANEQLAEEDRRKLKEFLRGYFYVKAADWPINDPHPISDYHLFHQHIPRYYIMPFQATMPQTVDSLAHDYPVATSRWLSDPELDFYAAEFERTGFQGGLNWYRMFFQANDTLNDLELECSKVAGPQERFKVPARFIAGAKDWGTWQTPGATDKMKTLLTPDLSDGDRRIVLIEGAGHWVQQEKPEELIRELVSFLQADRAV